MGLLSLIGIGKDDEEEKPEGVSGPSAADLAAERAEAQRKALEEIQASASERSQEVLDQAESRGEITQERSRAATTGAPIQLDEVRINRSDRYEPEADPFEEVATPDPGGDPRAPVPAWGSFGQPSQDAERRMSEVNDDLYGGGRAPAQAPQAGPAPIQLPEVQVNAGADYGTPNPQRNALQQMQGGGGLSAPPQKQGGPSTTPLGENGPSAPPVPSGTEGAGVSNAGPGSPMGQAFAGQRLPALQAQADQAQGYTPDAMQAAQPEEEGVDPLVRGRRVDRALKGVQAILRLAGGIGSAVAGANGNMAGQIAGAGVAGLGRVAGSFGGYGGEALQDRQLEQRDQAQAFTQNRAATSDARQAEESMANRALRERQVGTMEARENRMSTEEDELAPVRSALMRAQADRMRTQNAGAEYETETSRASRDPSSDVSRNAQALIRENRAVLGRSFSLSDEQIGRMSAAELQPFVGQHGSLARALGRRGGGVGGAGASRVMSAMPERFAEANGEAAEARWRTMTASQRENWYPQANGDGEAGQTQILPGVTSTIELSDTEVRQLRAGLASTQSYRSTLSSIGEIARRSGGLSAKISPEARAEITPHLVLLSGMVATLGQTGTINEGEVPRINAALPDPSNLEQMTFGSFGTRLQTWQTLVTNNTRAQLRARGVPEDGIDRALNIMSRGVQMGDGGNASGGRAAASGSTRYTVTNARGESREMTLSAEQVARVEAAGGSVEAAP